MATHYSVLAWRIPGTGEPGGLPSMGLHRVGQDWGDLAAVAAAGSFSLQLAQKPIALESRLSNIPTSHSLQRKLEFSLASSLH